MFKRTATDLDPQPTTKQQRLTCPLKNARLLPDGCSCLSDMGNDTPLQNQHLTAIYNDRWIGRGGPMTWPLRSPKFTPMNVFLWGHVKALIYMSPVDLFSPLSTHEVRTWRFSAPCIYLSLYITP